MGPYESSKKVRKGSVGDRWEVKKRIDRGGSGKKIAFAGKGAMKKGSLMALPKRDHGSWR